MTAALNVSTERLITMGNVLVDFRQILYKGKRIFFFFFLLSLTRRDIERVHVIWLSQGRLKSVCLSNNSGFTTLAKNRETWLLPQRHVFAKMLGFFFHIFFLYLHLKCVFVNILLISFIFNIKFMFFICIIIIDLIFIHFCLEICKDIVSWHLLGHAIKSYINTGNSFKLQNYKMRLKQIRLNWINSMQVKKILFYY